MAHLAAVQVKLELGHRAQVRRKATAEGFTHDWMVFVRGPAHGNIEHFVDKVVFHLHDSFPRPKRVCKDPPYRVEESGYAGFILPIEVYFRNKEEPKKVRFDYDLFLHLEAHPPVNHVRCEKLTFNNPTDEFRRKLLKAGGVKALQEGSTRLHLKPPTLPDGSATPACANPKDKTSPAGKGPSGRSGAAFLAATTASITGTSSFSKLHKPSKDQRQKKDPKSIFGENQDVSSKTGFKESKAVSKEPRTEDEDTHLSRAGGRKRRRRSADPSGRAFPGVNARHPEKKVTGGGCRQGRGGAARSLPPFQELVEPGDSDSQEALLEQPSPASSASSSGCTPVLQKRPGHHSDVNEEDSEEEEDPQGHSLDPDVEPRPRRVGVSFSDGYESNGSSPSPPSHSQAPPSTRTANQQAYLEELVDLHRRLTALREGRVLQQVVNLIEETGHFHISSTTFDFDLCSLDRSTVRKLQSYLDAAGAS